MNDPNSEKPAETSADIQHGQHMDAVVESLQRGSEARRQSESHYAKAETFDVSDPRYTQHLAQAGVLDLEADLHEHNLNQQAQDLGARIVEHEVVPEYSSKEAISVIDLR